MSFERRDEEEGEIEGSAINNREFKLMIIRG